jgi:non-heme chloroperoxidase
MTSIRHLSRQGLDYTRRGAGPAVVAVHGWCLHRRMWTYLEDGLVSAGHEVLLPDLAGFGASGDLTGPYTLQRHAADLADLLDETDLREVVLVGFAFGAGVLLHLPRFDRVRGLVLIGVPSAAHAVYDRMPKAMRRDWPEFARRSARAICGQPQSEATLGALERMFGGTRLPVALETVEVLGAFEPADVAHRVGVPALFVHGKADPIVPVSVSHDCAARMPHARVLEVPDSGHLVPLDAPGYLQEAVATFVTDGIA